MICCSLCGDPPGLRATDRSIRLCPHERVMQGRMFFSAWICFSLAMMGEPLIEVMVILRGVFSSVALSSHSFMFERSLHVGHSRIWYRSASRTPSPHYMVPPEIIAGSECYEPNKFLLWARSKLFFDIQGWVMLSLRLFQRRLTPSFIPIARWKYLLVNSGGALDRFEEVSQTDVPI